MFLKILLPLICLLPVYALASEPSAPFIAENAELFQWFLGLAIIGIGFFLQRTLSTIDKNNSYQWKAINLLDKRLSTLEGKHEAYHGCPEGGRRDYDPPKRKE